MYGGQAEQMPPRTQDHARDWLTWLKSQPHARIIEVAGEAQGEVRLHNLSAADRSARLAIGLFREDLLGRGIGQQAVRKTLDHAFGPMGLHRIDLKVLAFNTRAIACYRACGFVHEGTLREAVRLDDGWQDEWIMAVLAKDYSNHNSREASS